MLRAIIHCLSNSSFLHACYVNVLSISEDAVEGQANDREDNTSYCKEVYRYSERDGNCCNVFSRNAIIGNSSCVCMGMCVRVGLGVCTCICIC